MFEKVTLIGIGLIGSSIARAARIKGLARHIAITTRKTETLEGEPPRNRIVVIEFESVEKARAFYYGKYQEIIPLRQAASKGRMFLVEGAA